MPRANSIKTFVAFLIAGPLLFPLAAFAIPDTLNPNPPVGIKDPSAPSSPGTVQNTDGSEGFCTRVNVLIPQIMVRLSERKANLDARWVEQRSERVAARAAQKGRVEELRANEDGLRSSVMIKLEARAATSVQKAAVVSFRASMEAAIGARRLAMQSAQNAFQASLDALIAGRKSEETAIAVTYENAVKTAFNKAKADCNNRIVESIVRDRLWASLRTARDQFQVSRGQLEDQSPYVRELIDVRRTATQNAVDTFKLKAETALNTLKAAMGAEAGVR